MDKATVMPLLKAVKDFMKFFTDVYSLQRLHSIMCVYEFFAKCNDDQCPIDLLVWAQENWCKPFNMVLL